MKQEMQLIQQGKVTIAVGETPVLEVSWQSYCSSDEIEHTINFLRSGSPSVQWCAVGISHGMWLQKMEHAKRTFAALALSGETFHIDDSKSSFIGPHPHIGGMLLITRTCKS